tara:strand:- start:3230 stop:3358 length:129 start_codon:yes stop_codon:yes gene_type:complete
VLGLGDSRRRSLFLALAGQGTLHLISIILRNKCARESPMLFA